MLRPCEDRGQTLQEFLMGSVQSSHTTHGSVKDVRPLSSWDAEKEQDFSPTSELIDELEAQTGKDKEFDWWMYQVQIFFTNKFFPAYHHEKVLKAKIKENQIRNAELAELRRKKDEEIAKLIAEREAEDAKKQKEAAEEEVSLESKSTVFKELEEPGAQLAPPPKEEASAVPPPAVTKVPTGTKRRRK